jgi:hypothetical protein
MDLIWDGLVEEFRILGSGGRDLWAITLRSLLIAGLGVERFGRPLFVPDAGKQEADLGRP